jgi:hypothetical protein
MDNHISGPASTLESALNALSEALAKGKHPLWGVVEQALLANGMEAEPEKLCAIRDLSLDCLMTLGGKRRSRGSAMDIIILAHRMWRQTQNPDLAELHKCSLPARPAIKSESA